MKNHFIIILIYLTSCLLLLPYFTFQINPDSPSYLLVAQKYSEGDFWGGVNGYWSPLYSFLLVPFYLFHIEPIIGARLLNIFTGVLTLWGIFMVCKRLKIDQKTANFVLLILIPTITYYALNFITPDLLFSTLLVFYFYIIFDPKYSYQLVTCLKLGILGGLIFLSRAYGFYFFLLHFVIFGILHYKSNKSLLKRTKYLQNILAGFTIFICIFFTWIVVLHSKYGVVSTGLAAKLSHQSSKDYKQNFPMYYRGLIKPPNAKSTSIWNDPSYIRVDDWSPLDSSERFYYQIRLLIKNSFDVIDNLHDLSLFTIPLLSLLLVAKIPAGLDKIAYQKQYFYPLISMILFPAGYLYIHTEPRYLLPTYFFSAILISLYLTKIMKK